MVRSALDKSKALASVVCLLLLVQVGAAEAQSGTGFSNKNLTYRQYVAKNNHRISLELDRVPVSEALKKIAKKANAGLYFDADLLPDKRISLKLENVTLGKALRMVLEGTGLEAYASGRNILLREKPMEKIRSARVQVNVQTGEISGRVTDASTQEPLPGANVFIEGTTTGASTDVNGEYTIGGVEAGTYTLVARFVGFEDVKKQITVTENETLTVNFLLEPSSISFEEVVVVGYGSMKQEDLTGSISTISSGDIENLSPSINLDQALQGKAAGVYVVTESGQPGSASRVRIRGTTSLLGSNQPLYVIDGIPVVAESNIPDNGSDLSRDLLQAGLNTPLANINPDDIASISILKGASAAAIYGSRAANGVVIINTKRGSYEGETRFSAEYSISTQEAITLDVLNAEQFREIYTEAAENSTSTSSLAQSIRDGSYFGDANTVWEEEISRRNPVSSNFNISATGGTERIRYYASAGVNNQKSTFDNSSFSNYSALLNLDSELTGSLDFGTRLNFSSSSQVAPDGGLTSTIYEFRPDLPVFDEDGNYTYSNYYLLPNPVAVSTAKNENQTVLFLGSVFGELEITEGLHFRSRLSLNYNNGNLSSLYPSVTYRGGSIRGVPGEGYALRSNSTSLSHTWSNQLTYNKLLGRYHDVTILAGASWQGNRSKFFSASGRGFPRDQILTNLSSASGDYSIASNEAQSGLVSYYSRVKYDYNDRYLLTLSGRVDGSSKFAEDKEWAVLPAVAAAWRISNESFFSNVDFVDELKIRAGIGYTGQHDFSPYQARTLFSAGRYGGEAAVIKSQLGNSKLQWELSRGLDLGIDFMLFNGRLSGTVNYYEKATQNLLFPYKVPGNTGFDVVISNLGDTQNRGVELELNGDIIRSNDFSWNLLINVSHNKNVLVRLNDDFLDEDAGVINPPNTGSVLKVGEPVGLLYGYVADGIFQDQSEIDALNSVSPDGVYQDSETAPGDLKFKDISGPEGVPDGKVTREYDQTIIGNAQPDFTGGFTSSWGYKGFNLSAHFTYSVGNDLFWDAQRVGGNFGNTFYAENKIAGIMNRWTPENPTNQPRAVLYDPNFNARRSSYYVHDASYLRLRDVYFSYRLPQSFLSEIGFIRSASVYANAYNLITFTKYPGADPETNNLFDNDISMGTDINRYPAPKAYTMGIKIEF